MREQAKAAAFIGITFGVCWGMFAIFLALGGTLTFPRAMPVLLLYMIIPALTALLVQRAFAREPVVQPLGIRFQLNGWWLLAWLLPLLLALLAFAITLLFPQMRFASNMEGLFARFADRITPEQLAEMRRQFAAMPAWVWGVVILVQGMTAGATINALFAFGEELGWRGFLLRVFGRLRFWPFVLLTGAIWGLWHAPIILQGHNYPQHPKYGVLMMTGFTLLFTPLILYVRLRAKSVIAAAVMHGTLNGVAGFSILFTVGGSDLLSGTMGLAGFLAMGLLILALVFYDRSCGDPILGRRIDEVLAREEEAAVTE